MKKSLLLAGALLLSLASCRQADEKAVMAPSAPRQVPLSVTGELGASTRTALAEDGFSTVWSGDEYLKVIEKADSKCSAYTSAAGTVDEDGRISFQLSLNQSEAGTFSYYAVYPADGWADGSTDPEAVKFSLPATQHPVATSYGPEADVLVAEAVTDLGSQPSTLNMVFSRKVALGKMALLNLPTSSKVKSVSFSAPGKALAGSAILNLATGEAVGYGSGDAVSDKIVLDYGDGISPESLTVYFTCWPCALSSGEEVVVTAATDDAVYTKTITLSKALEFKANRGSKFTVDMADAEEEPSGRVYKIVTSADELTDGIYLIVNEEDSRAMNGALGAKLTDAKNNISVTISDGKIESNETTDAAAFIVNIREGSFLSTNGYYIGCNADANSLTASTSLLTNTVRLDAEGYADIIGAGGAYLRYNSASAKKQFRYFQSITYTTQKPVRLYKLCSGESEIDLTGTVYGAYFASGINWVYEAGKGQLSRTWSDGKLTFMIITPSASSAVEMSGIPQDAAVGDSFTLTVDHYLSLDASAVPSSSSESHVTVAKIEEPRMYLVSDSRDLFIVKK